MGGNIKHRIKGEELLALQLNAVEGHTSKYTWNRGRGLTYLCFFQQSIRVHRLTLCSPKFDAVLK